MESQMAETREPSEEEFRRSAEEKKKRRSKLFDNGVQ